MAFSLGHHGSGFNKWMDGNENQHEKNKEGVGFFYKVLLRKLATDEIGACQVRKVRVDHFR